MLFVHGNILGFRNVAAQLKRYAADREDVDAVHVDLVAPLWMKVVGKSIPRMHGWDLHQDRYLRMWGAVIDRWFRTRLDPNRFDVVHLMTQVNAWAMVRRRRRRAGGPRFAVNVDSTVAAEVAEFGTSRLGRSAFRRAEAVMFDAADLVVCRNRWCSRSLGRDYGVPADRIHVAANSLDPPARFRDPSPAPANRPVRIAFVGNHWRRKGGDLVLAAHQARLADRSELHVFGDRVPRDPAARGVVWHGRVSRTRLMDELLPEMDVFVLGSRYDMLPWALLEGAAAGLALAAPRTGAIPDVVRDGETGRLFEPGDAAGLAAALVSLVDDREGAARMGVAARERIRTHFAAERTYPALLDRLVALADDSQGPTR